MPVCTKQRYLTPEVTPPAIPAAALPPLAAAAAAAATHPAGAVDLGAMWIHEAGAGNAVLL
jgi:hypothetical protein